MALVIQNPEAEALAARLAQRTGETVDEATTRALEERLANTEARALRDRLAGPDPESPRTGMAQKLLEIGRQFTSDPGFVRYTQQQLDDWMYDENGLPH